jgi:hypothetical protein
VRGRRGANYPIVALRLSRLHNLERKAEALVVDEPRRHRCDRACYRWIAGAPSLLPDPDAAVGKLKEHQVLADQVPVVRRVGGQIELAFVMTPAKVAQQLHVDGGDRYLKSWCHDVRAFSNVSAPALELTDDYSSLPASTNGSANLDELIADQ